MKRRDFVFNSLKAATLLSSVLSVRIAHAQTRTAIKRALFWMQSNGYSRASDFFPAQAGTNFAMSPILQPLQDLRGDMVIINGINLRDGGYKPRANNHICSVGKVFTGTRDVISVGSDSEGRHRGPSVDHVIAQRLNLKTAEFSVDNGNERTMRNRPFARGEGQPKAVQNDPAVSYANLFAQATPPQANNAEREQRISLLRAKKSVLDDLNNDLSRFRRELSGDTEKLKLDIHEDAIRRAELSVNADIEATQSFNPPTSCRFPTAPAAGGDIPTRARAQMDLVYAALVCDLIQVGGIVWGWSGYQWNYRWVQGTNFNNCHEEVAHENRRDPWLLCHLWDWNNLGNLARRLKQTPDGQSNMLDTTLILGMNHFGLHHQITRIPVVTLGGKAGGLVTGRNIILPRPEFNDKVLTSVANYMGANIRGMGFDPNCGNLAGF